MNESTEPPVSRCPALFSGWRLAASAAALSIVMAGCGTLEYDLSEVPIPVSAKPAPVPATGTVMTLHIEAKNTLWVHGLFGQSQPDVARLVTEASRGYDRIAGFRVSVGAGFHDWLLTHLTGTMVRMKTVVIDGQLLKDPPK